MFRAREMIVSTRLETRDDGSRMIAADVRDSGEGIRPENSARIFDPFFTTKPGGTGLGLAIVKRILKAHGGTIEITSEAGRGTCASLRIPVDPENLT